MVNSNRCRITFSPRVYQVFCLFVLCVFSFAGDSASAQRLPSNVYRPPADSFNQGSPQITYPQRRVFQQRQTLQTVPQYQTIPSTQQFYYPQQNQTPIYQPPVQGVPAQVAPQPPQSSAPVANSPEIVELKRSLVKARDLMQKYQLKLEEVARKNQELEGEISTLQQSGDMTDSGDSEELAAARATASEAQQQMGELKERMVQLNSQLQSAVTALQTSTADLERQKQVSGELEQQIVELQKSVQMAAGSDQRVTQLTQNIQQFRNKNDELSGQITTLQNALREKETQIASMSSGDDAQLADLKELLEESKNANSELNTINKQLSLKLEEVKASAADMSAPQSNPELDELRADNKQLDQQNQQLGQQNQQLESENSQLIDMLGKLRSENSELDATVTRLSNMPAPVEATGFAAAAPVAAPSPDLTGLQNQLAAATRRNGQLERQLKLSKSKFASLTDENARLMKKADSESSTEVAAVPAIAASVEPAVAPVSVALPELGLESVSAGWPVKYWIFGMLGVGLAVGLGVAWYESVVDPKGLRRSTNSASN